MSNGRAIRIFLTDGSVTGIRHAELINWTGQAIAFPRTRISELNKFLAENYRDSKNTGVYFLFGPAGTDVAYIGESEDAYHRIGQHLQKDFWNEAVVFTSKDYNLTKAHALYLEAQLIAQAKHNKRYTLENSQIPPTPTLAPSERAAMNEFIQNMRILLGVLGYRILEPVASYAITNQQDPVPAPNPDILTFRVSHAEAHGLQTDEGFIILKGSQMVKDDTPSIPAGAQRTRTTLIETSQVIPAADNYVFTENYICTSSSAAAAIVAGSSRNGLMSWTDATGKQLKTILEEQMKTLESTQTTNTLVST